MITTYAQNNTDVNTQWMYTMMNTQNNTAAYNWGSSMDIAQMTTDPQGQLALIQNVMFTRLAMASNPQYITTSGGFNPNIADGMSVPVDPTKLISSGSSNSTSTSTSSAASGPYGTSSTSTSAPSTTTSSTSGASRRVVSSATAIFAAVAIAAFIL
jgi:hypothetical protein